MFSATEPEFELAPNFIETTAFDADQVLTYDLEFGYQTHFEAERATVNAGSL